MKEIIELDNPKPYRIDSYCHLQDDTGFAVKDEEIIDKVLAGEYEAVTLYSFVRSTEESIPELEALLNSSEVRLKAKTISDRIIKEAAADNRSGDTPAEGLKLCDSCGNLVIKYLEPDSIPAPEEYVDGNFEFPKIAFATPLIASKAARFLLDNLAPASWLYGNVPKNVNIDLLPEFCDSNFAQIDEYLYFQYYNMATRIYNFLCETLDDLIETERNFIALDSYNHVNRANKITEKILGKIAMDRIDGSDNVNSRVIYGYSYSFDHPFFSQTTEQIADLVSSLGGTFKVARTEPYTGEILNWQNPHEALFRKIFSDGIDTLPSAASDLTDEDLRLVLAAHSMTIFRDNLVPQDGYRHAYYNAIINNLRILSKYPEISEEIISVYKDAKLNQEDAPMARAVIQEFLDYRLAEVI